MIEASSVRAALVVCASALMLPSCVGSQSPISVPATISQSLATVTHAKRGGSWMLPEAKREDLVYATGGKVLISFTYPDLKQASAPIGLSATAFGACSDTSGDIFVVSGEVGSQPSSTIFEYAHGGSEPVNELSEPGYGWGCAVDPMTGNLAVANYADPSNGGGSGDVAIFIGAKGSATMYYGNNSASIGHLFFCGYDNKGNLYIDGKGGLGVFFELAKGSGSLSQLTFSGASVATPGAVQWDGKRMTMGDIPYGRGPEEIYQLAISGSTATVNSTVELRSTRDKHIGQYWIRGDRVLAINERASNSTVALWKYPAGGSPIKQGNQHGQFFGVTFSVAPSH